jgi:hypothetical protein
VIVEYECLIRCCREVAAEIRAAETSEPDEREALVNGV